MKNSKVQRRVRYFAEPMPRWKNEQFTSQVALYQYWRPYDSGWPQKTSGTP